MSTLWTELMRWVGAGGMAGVVGYIVSRPKIRGEARQASGAGSKSEADARDILDRGTWSRANDLISKAEEAQRVCEQQMVAQNEKLRSRDVATFALLDTIDQHDDAIYELVDKLERIATPSMTESQRNEVERGLADVRTHRAAVIAATVQMRKELRS